MAKNKNLVETVNTYSFKMSELHSALGIIGDCTEYGKAYVRNDEDIKKGVSPNLERYRIETEEKGSHNDSDMRESYDIRRNYTFSAGLLKKTLGLRGFVKSLKLDGTHYIITTSSDKDKMVK